MLYAVQGVERCMSYAISAVRCMPYTTWHRLWSTQRGQWYTCRMPHDMPCVLCHLTFEMFVISSSRACATSLRSCPTIIVSAHACAGTGGVEGWHLVLQADITQHLCLELRLAHARIVLGLGRRLCRHHRRRHHRRRLCRTKVPWLAHVLICSRGNACA